MDSLEHLALKTAQLPSLPELINDLQLLINANADLNIIADLLATDTSLTAQVIELANSAFYGQKNIARIFDAVHLIGLNRIVLFVRTAYTVQLLQSIDGSKIDMRQFWKQSYTAAITAQELAVKINYPYPDSMYTTGLLMYIGRLILALLPADFKRDNIQHHKLAASQLELWNFPPIFIESIGHMLKPSESADKYALSASIIHLTDLILKQGKGELDQDALLITNLSENEIISLAEEMKKLSGLKKTGRFRLS